MEYDLHNFMISNDFKLNNKEDLKECVASQETKNYHYKKQCTNLGTSSRFASTLHSGLVLNWFLVSHNFKNGWKIIDQTK